MTCKDCIHSGLCYKENDYDNFPDRCGDFISNDASILDEKSSELLINIIEKDEDRCSNCGKFLKPNEGTIIAGRWRTFILCSECKDKIDDFVKWGDKE